MVDAQLVKLDAQGGHMDIASAGRVGEIGIDSNHVGYSGVGFANFQVDDTESVLQWKVQVPEAGTDELGIRYALESGDRPLRIVVNEREIEAEESFPATGGWTQWERVRVTAVLEAGEDANDRSPVVGAVRPDRD